MAAVTWLVKYRLYRRQPRQIYIRNPFPQNRRGRIIVHSKYLLCLDILFFSTSIQSNSKCQPSRQQSCQPSRPPRSTPASAWWCGGWRIMHPRLAPWLSVPSQPSSSPSLPSTSTSSTTSSLWWMNAARVNWCHLLTELGGGVNIDRSKLSWFHLTQHSLAHLVMFYILGFAYGCKLPPRTAKTIFSNPKAPPFGFEKIFFFKSPKIIFLAKPFNRNRSHDSKKVWHLGIRNIFGNIFLKNIFKNIFSKNIYKNIFNTQVLYHFGILRPIPIEWLC